MFSGEASRIAETNTILVSRRDEGCAKPRRGAELRVGLGFSLNSLQGGIYGIKYWTTVGVLKGDTRSLDYSANGCGLACLKHLLQVRADQL